MLSSIKTKMDFLEEGRWKDPFDELLDSRTKLNKMNIVKQNVRVPYNIDSSVENSSYTEIKEPNYENEPLTFEDCSIKVYCPSDSISTPCDKRLGGTVLFQSDLSPITHLKLDGVEHSRDKCADTKETDLYVNVDIPFQNIIASPKKGPNFGKKRLSNSNEMVTVVHPSISLNPGKWRKSLNNFIRSKINETNFTKKVEHRSSICQDRKSLVLKGEHKFENKCEEDVLKYCHQCTPLPFNATYEQYKLLNSKKIGEGAYGEVFRCSANQKILKEHISDIVLKIIPLEGSTVINGEKQKTFSQILPEIIITNKMCSLRTSKTNSTNGFVSIRKVSLVKGRYPPHFINLWEKYDNEKGSENDHPELFGDNQLFAVLELKFAGSDMANFKFLNSEQSYYALKQIILALAVGEEEYQFEHRDLHLGNILIEYTNKKHVICTFKNSKLTVLSKGVNVTIIDYTLSRITINDCCYFNDLSRDEELFQATGDYQYDVYRMMRNEVKNNWSSFSPKTNIIWLSYVIVKVLDSVKYKSINTKVHRMYINKIKELQNIIMTFESASQCANYLFNLN
ncbi:putative serine/threonine-protein kinase haspin homolog isoform X1 [Drosophila mauritiana]|uniref:non-specific serine/threonine protein kinase n=2 Tax=Drosophila mauritiana TaxID=7226 RepID=A0A6P8JKD9_DROMA|nr:putative serine/threonine-protein kinase haspin homolog isoform X1 [Drosophila mauritiana]